MANTESSNSKFVIRLSDLRSGGHSFDLRPEKDAMDRIAQELDLLDLRKLRFSGQVLPDGPSDWILSAVLGATVTQPCRVTLAPVTTRIDAPIDRRYVANFDEPGAGEVEMPEDDSVEPLPEVLNLEDVMHEALALALPDFPRADDAALETTIFTEPGKAPMTDDDAKPFAGLAELKNKLDEGED